MWVLSNPVVTALLLLSSITPYLLELNSLLSAIHCRYIIIFMKCNHCLFSFVSSISCRVYNTEFIHLRYICYISLKRVRWHDVIDFLEATAIKNREVSHRKKHTTEKEMARPDYDTLHSCGLFSNIFLTEALINLKKSNTNEEQKKTDKHRVRSEFPGKRPCKQTWQRHKASFDGAWFR